MAEFKLGRIRFVWKGAWVAATTYYIDDVVRYGGKTYICAVGHTAASDFNTDLEYNPTKWNQMSDGQAWKGNWATSTFYKINDVVKYGGLLYICNDSHTSASSAGTGSQGAETTTGLEADQSKWTLFAEGLDWKDDWATLTRYKVNDLVKYGGITYVCNTGHTSAATATLGLEDNQGLWDEFNQGIEYKGAWTTTTRYKLNDVVKYGAGSWICITDHTSSTFSTDQANWAQFVEGLEYESTWSSGTTYQPGDIVSYGGNQYVAKTINLAANPLTSTSNWDLFTSGFKYQSDWSISTSYKIGDVIRNHGYTYVASTDSPSLTFTVTASSATNNRFTVSANTGIVAGMAVRFSGTTFGSVFTGATYYVKALPTGDSFTITDTPGGTEFVPTTASGSMTATIAAHPANTSYWSRLNSGFRWIGEWTDDYEYELGDVTSYGANTYVCIKTHRSEGDDGSTIRAAGGGAANSRPDLDTTGTYWNVLVVGSEESVLTTKGDLVYYGGSGPVRLPIGEEGQVLRVSSNDTPEWVSLGAVDHVYYVAPTGADTPAPVNGITLDKPWKTIRYAAQQIEKGPRNPKAKHLLEINRVFIQREVTAWIRYQIDNATVGSIWYNFDYDEYKCERDVGFIVDRINYDISHGGNLKTLSAALTYINALDGADLYATADDENGTGTYTKISTEGDNDVAAYNYMLEVITAVLAQEAPDTVYQNITDDSAAIVEQAFDSSIASVEVGALTEIAGLVGIVTTALTDGNANNLPARYVPGNIINVKAGYYFETLPIIVPAETAVQGDETRSVHVSPADSLIDLADSYYTVKSLDRLAEIVADISTGTAITATTGNTATQSADWPFANGGTASTDLSKKVEAMKYNIDFRLGTIHSYEYPDPTDYNTAYLTGYGDARTLILGNKEFFKAQTEAWLTENYPDLYYSRTSCKRDVGYITDALVYDLTYGGNAMSVQAGLAYYEGVGSSLYIDSTEKAATLAAYAYLKSMVQAAAVNTTITSLQSEQTQFKNVSLTGGTAAVTFLGNCLDEMIDIVNNGPSAETLTDPSTSWVDSTYTTDYSTMNSAVSTIQTATIDYINSNFGTFQYNSALCRRDAGYLIDAAYYDAAFGSNFWAVQNGISYYRRQAGTVLASQLAQEIGVIRYIKEQAADSLVGDSTAVTRSNAAYTEIIDILDNGVSSANSLVFTDSGTADFTNARAQLVTNRTFIINEMVTWMTANAPSYVALSEAGKALCERDLGYAIDALAYDVNYGGNLATRNFARSLFNNITGVSIQPLGEKTDSAASYTQLGAICAQIVRETYAGQDTSGTAASATEATRMTTLAGNIASVITAGNLSGLVAESAPSITWAAAGIQSAVGQLATDKTDIIAGALQYITDTYNDFSYNHSKCSRDVATIIKAVGYDMMFNSNFRTLKAGYAYLRATASEVFDLNQKTITRESLTFVRDELLALTLDAVTEARITELFDNLDTVIYSGSNEGDVCQSEDRMVDYAILQLERNRSYIVAEMSAWMDYNYVNFDDYYDSATCARDIGYIVDAVIGDLATGSNFASSVAGESYYRIQAALVPGVQMMQTVAAVREAKRLTASYVTHSSQYTAVNAAFDNVIAILQGGLLAVPTYTWPDNGTSTATTVSDAAALQTNRTTMVNAIHSWLLAHGTYGSMYSGLTTAQQNKCKRDVGYMIDAVSYDLQYGGNMQSTIAGSAYYSFGTLQIAGTEKAASVATLTELATLMKAYTSSGGDTTVDTLTALIAGIINTGATEPMTYTAPSVSGEGANTQATHAAILAGKSAIKTSVTTYITNTFSSYTYATETCERDVNEMIDALKWDLRYSSNYQSLLCSRYYANAVIGNKEENMFLCRNGTGVRNMTLEGLDGDLTPENDYGTRRVTAGAYASLDPGWGPDDFRTWIISRSPYLQNCCCFGYGAIGQKIDGALHAGGYRSMVSNDFTQLISDGIGAWVTNNGRAELVSVFTYYSTVGYLAEAGGRIRGTNGNNSYGTFGSVAEGYDVTETPNTAVVDNKYQFKAVVGHVFTDSANDIYNFEFDNAGIEYTKLSWTISGAGTGVEVETDEFRDGGVYQVRLLDNVDDSTLAPEASGNFGGFGYVSNSNTAQGGDSTSITIAATDSELSSAYIGMKIYLDGGTGTGQYGIITTYNAGTKLADVVKESDGSAGWDHVVPGTAIVSPDASTTYTIEPRLSFTAPSYSSASVTLATTGSWAAAAYAEHHEFYTAVSGTTSADGSGATFNVLRRGTKYVSVEVVSGGTDYARLDTITIAGSSLGGTNTTNDLTLTVISLNTITGEIELVDFAGVGYGGNFIAAASSSTTINKSVNGTTWTEVTSALTSNVTALASGALIQSVDAGDFEVGRAYTITDLGSSTAWTAIGATAPAIGYTFVATDPGGGDGVAELVGSAIVGILSGSNATTYSLDGGATWNVGDTLPSTTTWNKIAYGAGRWIATNSTNSATAYSDDGGVTWTAGGTLPISGADINIAYGKGVWVAIKYGTTSAASSVDGGATWTARSMPATNGNWAGVAYGNNRFVAIDANTTNDRIAYSLDGTTWTAVTNTIFGASDVPTGIAYGHGVFAVVSAISGPGTNKIMTSEDAINWTERAGSGSIDPLNVVFGNPNQTGAFVSLPDSSSNTGFRFRQGAKTRARAYVSQNKIYSIKIVEPGSGYSSAPTMTITDPNDVYEAPTTVRIGNGVLANPSFVDRGTGYTSASAEINTGDGYADFYQDGQYIAVRRLTQRPVPGSNIVFGHLPDETFKLVNILSLTGTEDGSYNAFFQVSPNMKAFSSPPHGTSVTTRIRYSQVRLTGHDFLNVGYGNFTTSNYPNNPLTGFDLTQVNETVESNGGRVFFTSTDQDGNFRVGDLFTVEQSTGVATLNADAFNIAGLQELSLGEVTLGGGSASINEFSTDPFFTANSDSIVPTQRAIKAYIAAQIGGGGASLNVNSVTAGSIYIAGNQITTVAGTVIQMKANFEFRSGVVGMPVAWNYFLT